MDLSQFKPQQNEAYELISKWFVDPSAPQHFYLGGRAGTGKTSMVMPVADELVGPGQTIYAAYTGKAASVLQSRGATGASTMHSFLYHSRDGSPTEELQAHKDALGYLVQELSTEDYSTEAIAEHPKVQRLQGLIFQAEKNARRPCFTINPDSPIKSYKLSVLDEVSMVTKRMADDWKSFGRKVLVLGDPFQLPPVGGEGYFTKQKPDFMLTKIHRQAQGNPIIDLSIMIRNMEMPRPGWYGSSRVVRKSELSATELRDIVLQSDQLIVGKNETRHKYNNRCRMLKGYKQRFPMKGETLVCLRNNHELGILNGVLYTVVEQLEVFESDDRIDLLIEPQGGGQPIEVHSHTHHFMGKEDVLAKQFYQKGDAEEFDYGYALTCHKSQGSQFKNPVVFDQSRIAGAARWQWLYTAVTRAVDSLTLVLPS